MGGWAVWAGGLCDYRVSSLAKSLTIILFLPVAVANSPQSYDQKLNKYQHHHGT